MTREEMIAEVKRRRLIEQVRAQRAGETKTAPAAAEGPGFLQRAKDTLSLGLSDALSTASGQTFGRDGDPTSPDVMGANEQGMKLAGDALATVGRVAGDAAVTAGKAVLPEPVQQVIGDTAQAVAQSTPVQAAGKGLDKWREASPRTYAQAGDAANIAAAVAPVPIPNLQTGARATQRLARTLAGNRARETLRMLTPDHPLEEGSLEIANNLLRTQEFIPNARYQGVINEVADIPAVNPRASVTDNVNAIENHVTGLRQALDQRLTGAQPIPAPVVDHAVQQAVARAQQSHTLVGDAGTAAERIYTHFADLVQSRVVNGEITPQALLDARRELDTWLRNSPSDVFSPGGAAVKVATREIRQSVNRLVDASAPGAGVAGDLRRMNQALEARDVLAPRAENEARTGLGRYMRTLEQSTGLKHPVNPQSAYITATNPVVGVATGGAALALGLRRGLGESWARFDARMENLLADAINNGASPAQKAAILAAMNTEKEKRNAP